jgi:hypothetical protein
VERPGIRIYIVFDHADLASQGHEELQVAGRPSFHMGLSNDNSVLATVRRWFGP